MDEDNARELTPVQMFWGNDTPGVKNFSPTIIRTGEDESLPESAPKDESVLASVISRESPPLTQPAESETLAQTPYLEQMENESPDVDKESGKLSESSEDESQTQQTPTQEVESSSQSSSSETSPGWNAPPAPVAPPINE